MVTDCRCVNARGRVCALFGILRHAGLVLFPLSLLLTAAISGAFANRSLKPVAELTRQASVRIQQLSHSAPQPREALADDLKTHDELQALAVTFNRLFGQLDSVIGIRAGGGEIANAALRLQGETNCSSPDRDPPANTK